MQSAYEVEKIETTLELLAEVKAREEVASYFKYKGII